ncbi:hypothetical protein ABZ570_29345 [Micromonospora sp. NPDC007271]|uniref:FIMAH domain-containing protein n=1 Tax=Micromonospora sp. NPDC007271 TaxID=3154587 RepID=UPI0033DB0EB3
MPSPTASPSRSSKARRTAQPAELIAALQTTIDGLEQQGHLRRDAGKELRKRLREVDEKLSDEHTDEAREKLRDFAEKLIGLREEDDVTVDGYEVLAAGATQLAQALSAR